ncbi:MAG: hypothetical protein RL263_1442 [Bacteroidota bacterium]
MISRQRTADSGQLSALSGQWSAGSSQLLADSGQRTADSRQPTTDSRQPITKDQILTIKLHTKKNESLFKIYCDPFLGIVNVNFQFMRKG